MIFVEFIYTFHKPQILGHDFCGIYIYFSQISNFRMFKRCPCNYFQDKVIIRWSYILATIKIHCKNLLLRTPHVPILVTLECFDPTCHHSPIIQQALRFLLFILPHQMLKFLTLFLCYGTIFPHYCSFGFHRNMLILNMYD